MNQSTNGGQGGGPSQLGATAASIPTLTDGPLRGRRVLVADDEWSLVDLFSRKLKQVGCQVTAAGNGRVAWEAFRLSPSLFDLVITDLDMPEMDGMELARRIHGIRPELPLVLVTGVVENLANFPDGQRHFQSVLQKPVTLRRLQETVERLMEV